MTANRHASDHLQVHAVSFSDRDVLFDVGDPPTGIFIIESGVVEIYRASGDRRIPMARLQKGDIVGELAMVENKTHMRGARAVGPTECLLIDPKQFANLMGNSPPGVRMIIRSLVRKLHRTNTVAFGKSQPRAQ
jgi:CRP-like cAMP-binding protein